VTANQRNDPSLAEAEIVTKWEERKKEDFANMVDVSDARKGRLFGDKKKNIERTVDKG